MKQDRSSRALMLFWLLLLALLFVLLTGRVHGDGPISNCVYPDSCDQFTVFIPVVANGR